MFHIEVNMHSMQRRATVVQRECGETLLGGRRGVGNETT